MDSVHYLNIMSTCSLRAEENAWLVQSKESCESLRIKTDQIIQYFQSHVWCVDTYSPVMSIRNLVGKAT